MKLVSGSGSAEEMKFMVPGGGSRKASARLAKGNVPGLAVRHRWDGK